jgi:hypothetical protein
LPTAVVRTAGFAVLFGDATDLEVEGRCFDAARTWCMRRFACTR